MYTVLYMGKSHGQRLSRLQDTPVATREESGVFSFPSRRGLTPRVCLICEPEIPVAPGEKQKTIFFFYCLIAERWA